MTRYLLDSNVLLHVVNRAAGYEKIVERLAIAKMGTVLVSAVTVWDSDNTREFSRVQGLVLENWRQ